jgi:hypothetical protein
LDLQTSPLLWFCLHCRILHLYIHIYIITHMAPHIPEDGFLHRKC